MPSSPQPRKKGFASEPREDPKSSRGLAEKSEIALLMERIAAKLLSDPKATEKAAAILKFWIGKNQK